MVRSTIRTDGKSFIDKLFLALGKLVVVIGTKACLFLCFNVYCEVIQKLASFQNANLHYNL